MSETGRVQSEEHQTHVLTTPLGKAQAECSCGWKGARWDRRDIATGEAVAHRKASS